MPRKAVGTVVGPVAVADVVVVLLADWLEELVVDVAVTATRLDEKTVGGRELIEIGDMGFEDGPEFELIIEDGLDPIAKGEVDNVFDVDVVMKSKIELGPKELGLIVKIDNMVLEDDGLGD